MNELVTVMNSGTEAAQLLAAELADFTGIDNPATWTPEALLKAIRDAKANRRAAAVNKQIDRAVIDYEGDRQKFLDNISKSKSPDTRRAYNIALKKLEEWTGEKAIKPVDIEPMQADDFIYYLGEKGYSPATVRTTMNAVSSFFNFLFRRYPQAITNPFRGTRALPKRKSVRPLVIPTVADYKKIIATLPPLEKAIVSTLALRGLRAGALTTLNITGSRFTGYSKGNDIKGELPAAALDAIRAAGLDLKKPFAGYSASAIERRINRHIGDLYKAGKIAAPYSAHDFRHFYAKTEYQKDKDLKRVQVLLGHKNIAITDAYLRSLDADIAM